MPTWCQGSCWQTVAFHGDAKDSRSQRAVWSRLYHPSHRKTAIIFPLSEKEESSGNQNLGSTLWGFARSCDDISSVQGFGERLGLLSCPGSLGNIEGIVNPLRVHLGEGLALRTWRTSPFLGLGFLPPTSSREGDVSLPPYFSSSGSCASSRSAC